METSVKKKRSRLIAQRGSENFALRLEDIAFFYTENKIVFVIDCLGKKYICDKNLSELEEELDKNTFFRANRQFIINVNFIRGFRIYEKVKLQVYMIISHNNPIIISQEMSPVFKKWINEV